MTSPTTYANHVAVHQALDAASLLRERGLGSNELMVLICLARHLGKDEPRCWVSHKTIAKECLFSRATAMRAVRNLTDFVSVTEGPGRTNVYRVTFSPVAASNQSQPATSSSQQLVPVAASNQPVATSNSTSCSLQHEVVQEVVQGSSEGEVVNRSSPDEEEDRSLTTATQVSDRKQARALADLYFEHLGSPARLTIKLATDWPDAFDKLLTDHSAAELRAVIDWVFLTDTFWPTKLKGIRRVDPVDYFREKLPTILSSYSGATTSPKTVQTSTNQATGLHPGGSLKGFAQWKVE